MNHDAIADIAGDFVRLVSTLDYLVFKVRCDPGDASATAMLLVVQKEIRQQIERINSAGYGPDVPVLILSTEAQDNGREEAKRL